MPPPYYLTSCTTKANLYFDSSFGTVTSESALQKLRMFHVPNIISKIHCLDRSSKEFIQVWGSLWIFVSILFFTVGGSQPYAQPPSWKTTPCQLSTAAYSMCLQLPSIPGDISFIQSLRTRHAVVRRDPPNMACKYVENKIIRTKISPDSLPLLNY
jgi:hypothetical protein